MSDLLDSCERLKDLLLEVEKEVEDAYEEVDNELIRLEHNDVILPSMGTLPPLPQMPHNFYAKLINSLDKIHAEEMERLNIKERSAKDSIPDKWGRKFPPTDILQGWTERTRRSHTSIERRQHPYAQQPRGARRETPAPPANIQPVTWHVPPSLRRGTKAGSHSAAARHYARRRNTTASAFHEAAASWRLSLP